MTSVWLNVPGAEDLCDGEMAKLDAGSSRVVVYKVNGEYFATDNVCTHAFALLSDGWLDDDIIECPLHAGRFNVKTGEALGDPVECDLTTFPVRLLDGKVQVLIPDE